MRVIAKRTLRVYWARYPEVRTALESWHAEFAAATYTSPRELKETYPHASILAGNRVVFNIKGNHFRLIVKIKYSARPPICYVRFIGTHAEYDEIDANIV